MIETKEAFTNLNAPEVIEERNKLIAARIGKELGYSTGKMQEIFSELSAFSADPTPRRIIECLYQRFWPRKTRREDIQKIINKCHEEAFEWFQRTHLHLLIGREAVGELASANG